MNLYAICPIHAPYNEVSFTLAESDAEAMNEGIFAAAQDAVRAYKSPRAEVFLVVADVTHVGDAWATDAPQTWEWAHPAVEENEAAWACEEALYATNDLPDALS
ncbi:MAG: hypothetical protein GEV09_05875 [Pseudonocardiaceae bacterium]|nr:hypothetical protein [Pseudonocardiaceae bacterium]